MALKIEIRPAEHKTEGTSSSDYEVYYTSASADIYLKLGRLWDSGERYFIDFNLPLCAELMYNVATAIKDKFGRF